MAISKVAYKKLIKLKKEKVINIYFNRADKYRSQNKYQKALE